MNLKNKGLGCYFSIAAVIVGIAGLARFYSWASAHNAMNMTITAALAVAVIFEIVLVVKEISILKVAATACYTYAAVRLLADSVGSFVDSLQGINMFGDATQVGNIVSIAITMGIAVVLSLIASFMKVNKNEVY